MMYRYHRSRKNLNRSPAGGRGKKGASKHRPVWTRGIAGQWLGPISRVTKIFLYALPLAGVAGVGLWGWNAVTSGVRHSSLFALQEVRTVGWERPEKIEVLKRLRSSLSGASLLDLDLVSLKRTLLAQPWIRDVNLRKEYPDTLAVRVIERRPAAVLAGRQVEAIVDETGTVLEVWSSGGEIPNQWSRLPVIHGVEPISLRDGGSAALQRFGAALEILRAASSSADPKLDLDVSRWDDVRVQRHGYGLRFGEGRFDEKWRRFLSVESEIERRHEGVREVDLRFPNQVVVR
jgi:cell division protein FtsQ